MNNFENITKDLETLKCFIKKHDIPLDCEMCNHNGLICEGLNCSDNFIKYLELEAEEKQETDINSEDWNKYIKQLDNLIMGIAGTKAYTSTNYLINHLKGWLADGYKLTNNEKKIILDMENRYKEGLEHLHKLQNIFDLVKQ